MPAKIHPRHILLLGLASVALTVAMYPLGPKYFVPAAILMISVPPMILSGFTRGGVRRLLRSRGWRLKWRHSEWLVRDYEPREIREALSKDDFKLTLEHDEERDDYYNLRRRLDLRRIKKAQRRAYEEMKPDIERWKAAERSRRRAGRPPGAGPGAPGRGSGARERRRRERVTPSVRRRPAKTP